MHRNTQSRIHFKKEFNLFLFLFVVLISSVSMVKECFAFCIIEGVAEREVNMNMQMSVFHIGPMPRNMSEIAQNLARSVPAPHHYKYSAL